MSELHSWTESLQIGDISMFIRIANFLVWPSRRRDE